MTRHSVKLHPCVLQTIYRLSAGKRHHLDNQAKVSIYSTTWLRRRTKGVESWRSVLPGREFWRTLVADERRLELIRTLCVLALVIMLSQASARLVWAFFVPAPAPAPEISASAPAGPADRRPDRARVEDSRGEKLASLHLFGRPDPPQAESEMEAMMAMVDAPETTLSLVLTGLLAYSTGDRGLAVIAEQGGEQEVYGIGDTVPGNAEIEAIYPDRVMLRRAGNLETLYLEDQDDELRAAITAGAAGPTTPADSGDDGPRMVSRSFVDESLANMQDLARQVQIHIHNPSGGRHGFRLVAPGGSDFLDDLGLQPDDILYEVNGIELSDAGAGMEAFSELRNARQINLVYERDGQERSSTIVIR